MNPSSSHLLSLPVVNGVCPRRRRFALSHVLAAHLHPCAAPASSGLLLVRLTTSAAHTQQTPRASASPVFSLQRTRVQTCTHGTSAHVCRRARMARRALPLKVQTLVFTPSPTHSSCSCDSSCGATSHVWLPRHNERPRSPGSIFHAGAAALSSSGLSQGFITSDPTQIRQIWTDLTETGCGAGVAARLNVRSERVKAFAARLRLSSASPSATFGLKKL